MSAAQVNEHIAAVNRASARVIDLYGRWVRGRGLSYNRFIVLYALLEGGPLTQRAIAERTHLIKQTVSNLVAALAEEGYAELAEGSADRREKLVSLTPAGAAYAQEIVGDLLQLEAEAVERMGEQRMAELAELTEAFGNTIAELLFPEGV